MTIADAVTHYQAVAGGFGKAVPLTSFGLQKVETEKLFGAWDEDYQINRFMLLTLEGSGGAEPRSAPEVYRINGFDCTHVTFQPGITELL